ncbi:hypothetical protein GCM10010191_39030 [Actinomadura vinacea]|uniref:Uncharacterized protein n=1 Tax=Actinomadura vinacea TaxID=115336 RepID=A0ABN3J6L7_9ACTN
MGHQIAPDTTKPSGVVPTHYHCYRWSGSGQEWDRMSRTDSLDLNSPDRPPVRTVEWLGKSPRFIEAVHTDPAGARNWLVAEWERACERAMNPVPDWVRNDDRAERALHGIRTCCWPTYSQWLVGGMVVFMSVVGTDQGCH